MRYLIINADDYGLNEASNVAVERLFNEEAITTTTLMVTCPYAEDGIRRAQANPRMKVGLHLTTTCEYDNYRWGPICTDCTSLVSEDGCLYRTAKENLGHATYDDMVREINAQYDWFMDHGYRPEHVDSHMATVYGLHGFSCLEYSIRFCHSHGLNFRFPHLTSVDPDTPSSIAETVLRCVRLADELKVGLPTALYTYDYDVEPGDTYEKFRGSYMEMVSSCPEGVSEMFMHPCVETDQLKGINSQWKKRVWEYEVLLDPVFRRHLETEGIRLTTYSEAPFFSDDLAFR